MSCSAMVVHEVMKAAWLVEPHRFSVIIDRSEWTILREEVDEAVKHGWNRIMPMFGLDANNLPNRCGLSNAYTLGKLKAFLQLVIKAIGLLPPTLSTL